MSLVKELRGNVHSVVWQWMASINKSWIHFLAFIWLHAFVAVSCGFDTCFAVKACDGLCHLTKSIALWLFVSGPLPLRYLQGSVSGSPKSLDYTQKLTRSTLALKLSVAPPVYHWVTATGCTLKILKWTWMAILIVEKCDFLLIWNFIFVCDTHFESVDYNWGGALYISRP